MCFRCCPEEEIYYSSGEKERRSMVSAKEATVVSDKKRLQLMTRAHFCEGLAKAATYSHPPDISVDSPSYNLLILLILLRSILVPIDLVALVSYDIFHYYDSLYVVL